MSNLENFDLKRNAQLDETSKHETQIKMMIHAIVTQ